MVEDLSALSEPHFWEQMAAAGRVWLHDEQGGTVQYKDLPSTILELRDDPYRSLAGILEDHGGYVKNDSNRLFLDFKWALFLRAHMTPLLTCPLDNLQFAYAVTRAMEVSKSQAAAIMPGFAGMS